jgi:hypothetical protein
VCPGLAHRTVRCATGQCPVHHRIVSGAPGNSTHNSSPSGIFRGAPLQFTRLSGASRESNSKLASFGNLLRYNSPDCPVSHRTMSGAHRTVWCDSGATATSRATVDCNALNARLRAQRCSARAIGTPDSLQGLSGAPPDSQAGPQVRAPMVGTQRPGDVAGAPDTVWCAHRQQPPSTVKFGGWGYKYPNHPHIQVIQVFHLPATYKS